MKSEDANDKFNLKKYSVSENTFKFFRNFFVYLKISNSVPDVKLLYRNDVFKLLNELITMNELIFNPRL